MIHVSRRAPAVLLASALLLAASATPARALEWLGQYGVGQPGGGVGQVGFAYNVAVSSSGDVLIPDLGDGRLAAFSRSGRFLWAAGKNVVPEGGTGAEVCTTACENGEAGSGSGELGAPFGVAVGPNEIYVTESGNQRVSAFDYQGQFLRAFGKNVGGPGVDVCTSICGPGTAGIGSGEMATPAGAALDAAGNLYVTELGSARVDVYNPQSGQFIRAFGKDVGGPGVNVCTTTCTSGVSDGSPGSINTSFSLAISAAGEAFVSEVGASRVSVFSLEGQFLRAFGSAGSGVGQLTSPYGVGVTPAGSVYVADSGNNRLDEFGVDGSFRQASGLDVIPGPPVVPETCTTSCQTGTAGYGIGEFANPLALATDCRGAVYVATIGRIDKYGDAGARVPPCESNAFSFGKAKKNKKKGTTTLDVTVPGPGTLVAKLPKKMSAKFPQPVAAGAVHIKLTAKGKGAKVLRKKGRLKGTLKLTFTPPNEDPATKSKSVQLVKKAKKHRRKG
jgi:sugar lactone lactonase YvrE